MLIAETEYRYQVEEDIKPFRDVLLGLFFVSVGMYLNLTIVADHLGWVLPAADRTGAGRSCVLIVILARAFRLAAGNGVAHRLLSGAGRRVRDRAAGVEHRSAHPGFDFSATGARGDGSVDAGGAVRDPAGRAAGPPDDGQRLAGARRTGHADRRPHDLPAGSRDRLRLRAQRPESRPAARGRGHTLSCAGLGSAARCRGGARGRQRRLCATPAGAKR